MNAPTTPGDMRPRSDTPAGRELSFFARFNPNKSSTMKTKLAKISILLTACALVACSGVTVSTDYDSSAHFAHFKTYTLLETASRKILSPVSDDALSNTLRTAMAARGIQEVTKGRPDLDVACHIVLNTKVSTQYYSDWNYAYGGRWAYPYGYYGMWAGAPAPYVNVTQYTEGTMILDFVNTRTNKVVFRGIAQAIVGSTQSNADKIRAGITKIMANFPVQATQ
jgi:hypothetical protein